MLDDLVLFFVFFFLQITDLVYLVYSPKTTPPICGFQPQMETDARVSDIQTSQTSLFPIGYLSAYPAPLVPRIGDLS